jgi:TPR repeat protein
MARLVLRMMKECSNAVLPALRTVLAAGLMTAVIVQSAAAGPLDDATAAHKRGDYAAALRIIQPLANQGEATAANTLGFMYQHGQGVTQNYAEAVRWYRRAADQGEARAQYNLGWMYRYAQGVTNYAEALKWFRKAADQGEAAAQFNLGQMYLHGQGVTQNHGEALKWFRKLADQGKAAADDQNTVGWLNQYGQGVTQNYAEAVRWYRRAADQGHGAAQFNLGSMYLYGYGVMQNYAEALKWFRKAANREGKALSALGWMYEDGQGVPQSYVQAYMWYNLAVSQVPTSDRDFVINLRNRVTAKMTSAQIAEGQRMSEHCLRSNYADCESPQVARLEDKASPPPTRRNEVASTGTGFFVSEAGHIVTNAHVVEGCQTVRSSLRGTLRRVSVDEESDLALYIALEKTEAIARLHGGRGARAGESVVAVGFPLSGLLSSDPIVTTGIISALSGLRNDRRTIQITAPVQPGNSGGPVLGENGSVIGVVVSKLNAIKVAEAIGDIPQNVNFAVSLGTLQSFLNANNVPYVLDDSKATKTPADITAEATHYTVLLECLR